jgi:hypothetical protein
MRRITKNQMKSQIEKVKQHIKDHKVVYSCVATGVVSAGITCIIMRSNIRQGWMDEGIGQGSMTNIASRSLSYKSPQMIKVINVLEREGRGHPGYPVRNLESKHVSLSQQEAADYFGISRQLLSGHLNGKFPDVDGLHFERVNLVPEGE